MIKKLKCVVGLENVNISIGLFIFQRCSLITATMYANARYSICMHTPSQLYEATSFEKENPLLKKEINCTISKVCLLGQIN